MSLPDQRMRIVTDLMRERDVRWRVAGPSGRTRAGDIFDGRWRPCSVALPLCYGVAVQARIDHCTCSTAPIRGLCDRWYEPALGMPANERPLP